MGEDLSAQRLAELVKAYNASHPSEFEIKLRGSSSLDLPCVLMSSFFPAAVREHQVEGGAAGGTGEGEEGGTEVYFHGWGFSESPYLKSEIKKQFEIEGLQVLVPRRPQVSVVRGACLFGLDPHSITSRIAKRIVWNKYAYHL